MISILSMSCSQKSNVSVDTKNAEAKVPEFNADSAYVYTETQVNFGPRVPNTEAHVACGNYLAGKLREFGAEVIEQEMDLRVYDGTPIKAKNIIGSYNSENKSRVLLFAHWDTRPFADRDKDQANHRTPIDGANDGAGACAVLLEIARQISISEPTVGIDIIFFDAEDWGVPQFDTNQYPGSGYCLGSDYWGRNPHVRNYKAKYGILLDMVSAPGARFHKEYYSMQYAANIVQKVWKTAQAIGYGNYFINVDGGAVEDDHVHVILHRQIPCIDIIQADPNSDTGFGTYWHTLDDNMENISRETMRAVGQTVLHVVYNEK